MPVTGIPLSGIEIVGVARRIKHAGSTDDWSELVYLPLAQNPRARLVLLLRTEQALFLAKQSGRDRVEVAVGPEPRRAEPIVLSLRRQA